MRLIRGYRKSIISGSSTEGMTATQGEPPDLVFTKVSISQFKIVNFTSSRFGPDLFHPRQVDFVEGCGRKLCKDRHCLNADLRTVSTFRLGRPGNFRQEENELGAGVPRAPFQTAGLSKHEH